MKRLDQERLAKEAKRQKLTNIIKYAQEGSQDLPSCSIQGKQNDVASAIQPVNGLLIDEIRKPTIHKVVLPKDVKLQRIIDRLAQRVQLSGLERVLNEAADYHELDCLRNDPMDPISQYFIWRHRMRVPNGCKWWNTTARVNYDQMNILEAPLLPPFSETLEEELEHIEEVASESDEEEYEIVTSSEYSNNESPDPIMIGWANGRQIRFENLLRELTAEKSYIRHAMEFVRNFDSKYSEPIADSLLRSIESDHAPFETKIARLDLASELLLSSLQTKETFSIFNAYPVLCPLLSVH